MNNLLIALTTTTFLTFSAIAQERDHHRDLENIEKRIKSALERGDITNEEAKAKYAEVKKMIEKKHVDRKFTKKEDAERKKREHVRKQRELDERQHREHQERAHREHEERKHHHSERQLDEARELVERQEERHRHARMEAVERSLHQAVEAGLISGLDAEKMMAKLHLAAIKHRKKMSRH